MKYVLSLIACFVVLFFVATPTSATVPAITATSPAADAMGVATTASISVTFNTSVNAVTTDTFYILDPTGYQVGTAAPSVSGNAYTLRPTVPLSPCTPYTIIVTTGVKSNDTNSSLAIRYARSFTTAASATGPTITAHIPASNATGILENDDVTVTFSQQMDPSTFDASSFSLNNGATGTFSYTTSPTTNGTIVKFTPSPNLVAEARYSATITTNVMSRCNVPLAATSSWDFVARRVYAPYVTNTLPSNGAANIPVTSPIIINFNSRMSLLGNANIMVTQNGTPITGSVANDTSGKTATFTPDKPFSYNTVYTFTLTNVTDIYNVALDGGVSFSFKTTAQQALQYCTVPSFVANSSNIVQPNVLLLVGNSNSMDEDFTGAAVGSYSPTSKSVIGKQALRNIIQTYADTMRIGIMTYNLPTPSKSFLSNAAYFASYIPETYCPIPPSDGVTDFCYDLCINGNTASRQACHNGCAAQNPIFDENLRPGILGSGNTASRQQKYCELVYPKTNVLQNPTDPTSPVYYKHALPGYSDTPPTYPTGFCSTLSDSYRPGQEIVNTTTKTDVYHCWSVKTGASNFYVVGTPGYSGVNYYNGSFLLTDSDLGYGFGNLGQMQATIPVGPAWFANSSPGTGKLKVPIATNDAANSQLQSLNSALAPFSGDSAGYMACASGNSCSYIVNAGLSPTAGALKTAASYFSGTLANNTSPITQPCQKNYIIYLTDGLPSADVNGKPGQGSTLLGSDVNPAADTVLQVVDSLHNTTTKLNGTAQTFDIKTYVIGYGLTGARASNVDLIAKHGGTGSAYNAANATQVTNALNKVFTEIGQQISSGTSASILSNSQGSGANLLQAVFYPVRFFDNDSQATWTGELQNLWYYVDPFLLKSSIREDTDFASTTPNHLLNLKTDKIVTYAFDMLTGQTTVNLTSDPNGNQTGGSVETNIQPEDVKSLWQAGYLLWKRSPATRTIHTSINGYSLLKPSSASPSTGGFSASAATDPQIALLQPYLQTSDTDNNAEAFKFVDYIRGTDGTNNYRPRRVSITDNGVQQTNEWKLGDIVNSTPRIQSTTPLNVFDQPNPAGYADKSYAAFIKSSPYTNRGMVYVGANDGMLHAFKLGKLTIAKSGETGVTTDSGTFYPGSSALLTGTKLGEEQWAYIPRSNLPYLKYLTDAANYKHINYVDGPTTIADVSIGSCGTDDYATCPKDTVNGSNWQTILIGSMGLGGATRAPNSTCLTSTDAGTCVRAPLFDPTDTANPQTKAVGYSSYFALDITKQYFTQDGTLANQPTLKWEFPPPGLPDNFGMGYATSGVALMRIAAKKTVNGVSAPDTTANGKWFAVIASGPTGPIDTVGHRFMGRSDQNLKLFVIDVGADITAEKPFVLNKNYWVIDTHIQNAFGGSIGGNSIDTDRWNSIASGNYQDDVLYVGYTKKRIDATNGSETSWTDGGVGRLLTHESTDPATWTFSTVIDKIGPVTTTIAKLQDRKNKKLWLYFGTGRFYYNGDDAASSLSNQRYLFGVQDTCYTGQNAIAPACDASTLGFSNLTNQTASPTKALADSSSGWYIALDPADSANSLGAERVISDTIALTNGTVLFSSFKPSSSPCSYGGSSYMWGVNYASGAGQADNALAGKALVQQSTGAFQEITLKTALTENYKRKSTSMTGKASADAAVAITNANSKPKKKILHIQEK